MDNLPVELSQDILSLLALKDLKNARLVCRLWAKLGEDSLIDPVFSTLPHRNDFARLAEIASHPRFSLRLKELAFNLAEMNEYHGFNNTIFVQYMLDTEERRLTREQAWNEYRELRAQKQSFAATYCDPRLLRAALPRLFNVRNLSISLNTCPFENELFKQVWRIPSTREPRRADTERRTNDILMAAASLKLRTFAHDWLPVEFFGQQIVTGTAALQGLFTCFKTLTVLRLELDFDTFRHMDEEDQDECVEGLGICLRAAPNLQNLLLGFFGGDKPKFDFWRCLGEMVWDQLHTLELEGMTFSQVQVLAFLSRHAETLRQLRLGGRGRIAPHARIDGGIALDQGSLYGLVEGLQSHLDLKKLHLYGDFWDLSEERFDLRPIYDETWEYLPGSDTLPGRALEDFVVRRGPYCGPFPFGEYESE